MNKEKKFPTIMKYTFFRYVQKYFFFLNKLHDYILKNSFFNKWKNKLDLEFFF